jgi:hypothetical protein
MITIDQATDPTSTAAPPGQWSDAPQRDALQLIDAQR